MANGPSLGDGLAQHRFGFDQRLDQNFFQGRFDAVPSAGTQLFVRYTLDDAEQALPTDFPQFPRAFVSRNQFLTGEYRSACRRRPSPPPGSASAARASPRPSSRTPRSPCRRSCPGNRRWERSTLAACPVRPAALGRPGARTGRIQRPGRCDARAWPSPAEGRRPRRALSARRSSIRPSAAASIASRVSRRSSPAPRRRSSA